MDEHDKCKEKMALMRWPVNFLVIKSERSYSAWFNYTYDYNKGETIDDVLRVPPGLMRKRKVYIITIMQPRRPCLYIGDKSASAQTIVQSGTLVDSGPPKAMWELFKAYARML